MKCKHCDGDGVIVDVEYGHAGKYGCKYCDGKGVVEPLTNEEWFCGLSTEEKAKVLRRKTYGNGEENEREEQGWVRWLKAKHEDNPPDIPSVPSWEKWLEGERTKCEYCDGNGAECNLVGRSECPRTPKTEQEYIQTCNTEQLAEVLMKIFVTRTFCHLCPEGDVCDIGYKCKYSEGKKIEDWEMWLKQPHREERKK